MAYSKFEFFKNFGQGQGTIPVYGTAPRTYEADLALLTNCPDYSMIRRVNAQIGDETVHDITIWVGIKNGSENVTDANLTASNVVDYVALGCPPYVEDLIGFLEKSDVIDVLENP
ncbi:MAG: hypothetical protein AAF573_20880 [Bacteroidota bacterium]